MPSRFSDRDHKYNSTPRKVFDKHVDAMERKRLRDREDHRNDLQAIFQRMKNLEAQLTHMQQHVEDLQEHVNRHCDALDTERSTEGLT